MDYSQPDKKRIIDVFTGKIPDRTPNFEVLVDNPVFSDIMGRPMSTHTLNNIPPKDYMEFAGRIGQDVVGMCFYFNPFFVEGPDGSRRHLPSRITQRSDLDKLLEPDIHWLDHWFAQLDEYDKAVKETKIGLFTLLGSFFTAAYNNVFGFDEFMYMLYDDMALVEEVLEIGSGFYAQLVEKIVEKDLTFLYIGDDLAFKSATLVPPEVLRTIWVPRMKKVFAPALKKNIPILFHSDGNIEAIIPDLIDMGINALNPIEPYGMDLRQIKEKFGKDIALVGNLDVGGSLSLGTPEDVIRDTKQLIDTAGSDGGLVVASSHSITKNVKTKNFLAMIETAQTYGIYR